MRATGPRTTEPARPISVPTGVLVFEDAEELDFVGPWEVFGIANRLFPDSFPARLLSTGDPKVRARYGLRVDGARSIYEVPAPRLLVIPGGKGRLAAMKDHRLLGVLREIHADGAILASVCTGAFILAAAGLLEGRSATTHWSSLDELRGYPGISVVERRYVDEGDIVTAAGISAGIDMSLHLVSRFLGADAAREVARRMEYLPSQPIA